MSGSRGAGRRTTTKKAVKRGAYRLRWTRHAEADLEAIGDYIAADDPAAAARWVEKLLERAR